MRGLVSLENHNLFANFIVITVLMVLKERFDKEKFGIKKLKKLNYGLPTSR